MKYQLLFCKKLFYENTAPGSHVDIQAFAGAVVILGLRETALFFKIMLSERRQERVHDFGKCF